MIKLLPVILIVILAAAGGYYFFTQQNQSSDKITDGKAQMAKSVNKSPKIGIVSKKSSSGYEAIIKGMKAEMTKLGYTPEYIQDEASDDNYDSIVKRYADLKVDVIVTNSTGATAAGKKGTTTIPVVFGSVGDPILNGIVTSLESSGSNVTGVSSLAVDLAPQRMAFLKDFKPELKKIIYLSTQGDPSADNQRAKCQKQAEVMGLELNIKYAKNEEEAKAILKTLTAKDGEALAVGGSIWQGMKKDLMVVQNTLKLPLGGFDSTWPKDGVLYSYGANYEGLGTQVAGIIDQIQNGKLPKDIPIQRAEKVDLFVNKKTATSLGVTVPKNLESRIEGYFE